MSVNAPIDPMNRKEPGAAKPQPTDRSALPIGKAPSSKHQAPEKSQTPNPNAARGAGLATSQAPVTANRSDAARKGCFGAWCLEFLWSLELGAWNFVGFAASAVFWLRLRRSAFFVV
jgi:hypothetical protein